MQLRNISGGKMYSLPYQSHSWCGNCPTCPLRYCASVIMAPLHYVQKWSGGSKYKPRWICRRLRQLSVPSNAWGLLSTKLRPPRIEKCFYVGLHNGGAFSLPVPRIVSPGTHNNDDESYNTKCKKARDSNNDDSEQKPVYQKRSMYKKNETIRCNTHVDGHKPKP